MNKSNVSPRFKARLAGVFQLLEGFASPFGQVVLLGKFMVAGSASATAANILARPELYRSGFALCAIAVPLHIVWAYLMYDLLKPVRVSVARIAVLVIIVGCAIQALSCVFYLAPLVLLQSGNSLVGLSQEQVQALAFALIKLNGVAYNVYLIFFGLWCLLTGYLIFRSTFLPRVLGLLLIIDGIGWMLYLSPPVAQQLFTFIAVAAGIAEFPLEFWLLIFAVNEARWKEQAARAVCD